MATLERAIEIAVRAHRGQLLRNGQPYILHPLHLMFAVDTDEERIVAVLHDVVEDTSVTMDELRKEAFSREALDALVLLTHDKDTPYEDYVGRLSANALARRVKLADLKHNMDITRLRTLTEEDKARLEKYHRAWRRLSDEGGGTPPQTPPG